MALTKVSFSMIAGSAANMLDYGAVGDGTTNDTAAAQAALNSGASVVVVPPGYTIGVTGLTMAANQTLWIQGKIKMLSGVGPVVLVNNNCTVMGGEIDGNSVNCSGIAGVDKINVTVDNVYVHNLGKVGVVSYKGAGQPENWRIVNNKVNNTGEQGISVEYTNNCLIDGNFVDTALHGIQWYGGDANTSDILGIYGLRIANNIVTNVTLGGIWGSLGSNISVVGNHVENCPDVGIDFEGCVNFTCSGNVAYECGNGCYAVFFGSKQGSFTGNVGRNLVANGSGFYATTNAIYRNENLVIADNVFDCVAAAGIAATENDGLSLSSCTITGNRISTGANSAIFISRNTNLQITNNTLITDGSGVGIQLQGVSVSVVSNNMLYGYNDTNASPSTGGGVWMYQQSVTWPCESNIVRNNRIEGYNYSIVDFCPTDVTKSKNDIEWNNLSNVYRSASATYNGVIANNIDYLTPATAVTATTF